MGVPKVRAVVLNYNGGEHVCRSVEALLGTDWPADSLEVVVVDNASTDGSDREIEARHPGVRVVRSEANLGFPANNLALGDLDGIDYAALINNDAFVDPGWLRPLVEVLEDDPGLGAACPKILFEPGFLDLRIESPSFEPGGTDPRALGVRVSGLEVDGKDRWVDAQFIEGFHPLEQGTGAEATFRWTDGAAVLRVPVPPGRRASVDVRVCVAGREGTPVTVSGPGGSASVAVGERISWASLHLEGEPYDVVNNAGSVLVEGGYGADRGYLEPDDGAFDEPADVFAWCGAGVLFPARYLGEVGLFDERFFMYYEDTDLAWRGRAQGWRYRYVPTSVLRHVHAATSVEGSPLFQHFVERNRLLLLTKNAPWRLALGAVVRYVLITGSYARRDVVRPVLGLRRPQLGLVRRRIRSFLGFVRLAPAMVADRRRLRRRQIVRDEELVAWAVPQP